jgi:hypothetical protein
MKKRSKEYNRLYDIHRMMKKRCYDSENKDYRFYGARGISVCTEWWSIESFYKWSIKNGYKLGLSIDRINNDGNYSPSNCRFVTMSEQGKNTGRRRFVVYKNKKYSITELCKKFSVNYRTTLNRLNLGWSVEKSISLKPVSGRNQYGLKTLSE